MNLLNVLLFAAVFQVSANVHAQRITYSLENVSLVTVFKEIRKQTGYEFLFNSQMLAHAKKVSIDVKNAPLRDVLDICFRDQPVTYSLMEKTIIVKSLPERQVLTTHALLPPVPVRGRVTNERGEPIVGATIQIKGNTKITTLTGETGDFTIRAEEEDEILIVSSVGYATREVKVSSGFIRVVLEIQATAMEVVITTGLYRRPKESFTGAATTVSGDEIRQLNMTNALDALKLFDPAMRIPDNVQFGSDPNRLPTITLRGTNNFPEQTTGNEIPASGADFMSAYQSNPSQPLFILDGFQVSLQKIYDLDIERIQSFTILKDAAATSIYGSRAANGVIVVETKDPQPGKMRVSYSGMVQVTAPDLTVYDLLNAREKLEVERLAGIYSEFAEGIRPDAFARAQEIYSMRRKRVEEGVNTYWLAQPVRTGVGQKHSFYMEGGDQYLRYGVNFGYNNNTGVMKNSNRNTYTGGMNISYRYKKFLLKNVLTVSFNKAVNSNYGNFSEYSKLNQYWSPYDSTGNIVKIMESVKDPITPTSITNYTNPLYNSTLHTVNESAYSNITNQTNLEFNMGNGFRLTGRVGLSKQHDKSDLFLPAQHTSFISQADFTRRGSYTKSSGEFFSVESTVQLDYSRTWGRHQLFNTTGTGMAQTNSQNTIVKVEGFPNDRLDQILFGNSYQLDSKPSGLYNITRRFSQFTNFNYNYDNRYQADISISGDGASQFGSEKRYGVFWSGGLGWNIYKEDFFKPVKAINELRLRATIGTTGDNNFNPNQAITTYKYFTDQNYRGMVGAALIGYGNANLKWQQTLKKNLGVNLSAFDSRVNIRVDVYHESTSDLILNITTPPSEGVASYKANIGELENKGYEFNLNAFLIRNSKKGLVWSVYVNGNHNKDKIKSISNTLKKQNSNNDKGDQTLPRLRFEEGMSTNAIWAVESLGIDPSTGRELYRGLDGKLTYTWRPDDKTVVGNSVPEMRGSFGTNVMYKGVSLGVYFSYEYGGQLYNQTLQNRVEDADLEWQVDRRVLEGRWIKPGDITGFKGLADINGRPVTSKTQVTSRFVQDNNFINCETVAITWQLPKLWNNNLGIQSSRLSFLLNDVKRWSSIAVERGLDYPFARNFTLNLNVTF